EERGEAPSLAEFQMRFPEFAGQLEQQLRLHGALHRTERQMPPVAPHSESATWSFPEKDVGLPAESPPASSQGETPRIGDYQVLAELGRGGMGVVYKALHRSLNRVVALKMVLGARFAFTDDLIRFRLEGEAAARLQHPNIVQVHEVGTHDGQPYLVLEYVE